MHAALPYMAWPCPHRLDAMPIPNLQSAASFLSLPYSITHHRQPRKLKLAHTCEYMLTKNRCTFPRSLWPGLAKAPRWLRARLATPIHHTPQGLRLARGTPWEDRD